jgi:hypothetical protein
VDGSGLAALLDGCTFRRLRLLDAALLNGCAFWLPHGFNAHQIRRPKGAASKRPEAI